MFNQHEVQILLGGVNSPIDIDDLKRYTNYGGVFDENHPAILLFWKVVEKFDQEQKRALLRFVTSCSRPPLLWVVSFCRSYRLMDPITELADSVNWCQTLLFDTRGPMRNDCRHQARVSICSRFVLFVRDGKSQNQYSYSCLRTRLKV